MKKREYRNESWQSWRRHDGLGTLEKLMLRGLEQFIKRKYPKSGKYITPDEHEDHHV